MATRSPPPSIATARPGVIQRMTRGSLRPVVVFTAILAGLWGLLGTVGTFREMAYHNSHGFPHLGTISLVMSVVYTVILISQVFSLFAVYSQKPALVATNSFVSIFAGVAIAATGWMEVIEHFTLKSDLINECTKEVDGDTIFFGWVFFGQASSRKLSGKDLNDFCNHAWNRDSISTVSFAVVLSALGLLLASKARAFLAQVRDPNYGRSVTPAPEHYAQSYPQYGAHPAGPGYASQPYGSAPYAPPMGSSPPGGLAPAGPAAPSGLETDKSYSAGSGAAGLSEVSLATAHPRNAQDNPFADFERIPDHERVNKRYDV